MTKFKTLTKLTIDRKTWGVGKEGGRLLNSKTKKLCCVGFYTKKCGFKNSEIENLGTPETLVYNYVTGLSDFGKLYDTGKSKLSKINKIPHRFLRLLPLLEDNKETHDNSICCELTSTNDSEVLDNPTREKKITSLFKKIKISVKFKGKYDKSAE